MRLQVAVQEGSTMTQLQGQRRLVQHLEDEAGWEVGVGLGLGAYEAGEVTAATVLHHYIDLLGRAVDDAVVVAHYVLVAELAQYVNFRHQLLLLLLVHVAVVQRLHGTDGVVGQPQHLRHTTERALADCGQDCVVAEGRGR